MVQWIVGSIPRGGHNELFLNPVSAPQLVHKMWYVLYCLWDNAYKRCLDANQDE